LKKVLRLTESDLKKIITKVIEEQSNVSNIKYSNDFHSIPDKKTYKNCAITRHGETIDIFIRELGTIFRIKTT
jgi:hypothetical protein